VSSSVGVVVGVRGWGREVADGAGELAVGAGVDIFTDRG